MKSRHRWIAVAVALIFSAGVRAQSEFSFTYAGTQTHRFDAWECPLLMCSQPSVTTGWAGIFSVLTDSSSDGAYDGVHLRIALDGRPVSTFQDGLGVPLRATVVEGRLVDLAGDFLTFTGLAVVRWSTDGARLFKQESGGRHYGPTSGFAILTAIPEPETYALFLGGMALIGWRRRRRHPGHGSRLSRSQQGRSIER